MDIIYQNNPKCELSLSFEIVFFEKYWYLLLALFIYDVDIMREDKFIGLNGITIISILGKKKPQYYQ